MDWTAGYASDIEYTAGFYAEQSPNYLNFICALNDMEPVPLERGFTYCELGFGRGLTVNLLAAANPHGQFYAADFNPSHVAGARALADTAALPNLTLLEASFEQLARGEAELPAFDFITLHGIYTWVTPENQAHIVAFISRYLKPGGVAYVSYNAMPGWTSALPLQRLLVEWGDAHPDRSDRQVAEAGTYVQQLLEAGAAYFTQHPANKSRLESLQTMSRNYLVHEYMHKHWRPLYHADVARALGEAKLEFVASADPAFTYTKLYLDEQRQALIGRFPEPAMRETIKDYFLGTGFRKDVYVRGARRMTRQRRRECLGQFGAALALPRSAVQLELKTGVGVVNGSAAIFHPVCDALAERPMLLDELAALPALAGQPFENLVQTLSLLSASGQAVLFSAMSLRQDVAPAQRMNRALAQLTRHGDEYQALCSPLLGNAIGAAYVERLLYWLLGQQPGNENLDQLAQAGWRIMRDQGRAMLRDGEVVSDEQENLQLLREQMAVVLRDKLARWRTLNML
jgi:SAM-dependent methyltransferase